MHAQIAGGDSVGTPLHLYTGFTLGLPDTYWQAAVRLNLSQTRVSSYTSSRPS